MSRYKTIATKIEDRSHLIAALDSLGLPYEEGKNLRMQYSYGTANNVSIVVRAKHLGLRYDDLGFAKQEEGPYTVYASAHNESEEEKAQGWVNRITQQYGKFKALSLAQAHGLNVVSEQNEAGVIRLKLRGYQ